MNRALVFTAMLVMALSSLPVAAWTTNISITSENQTMDFVIGTTDTATDDFDPGIDIPLPPPPPSSTFDAYLTGSGIFDMLQTDIRHTPFWSLHVQSKKNIEVQWDVAPTPLKMEIGTASLFLNRSGRQALNAGNYQIQIHQDNVTLPSAGTVPIETPIGKYQIDNSQYSMAPPAAAGATPSVPTGYSPPPPKMNSTPTSSERSDGQNPLKPGPAQPGTSITGNLTIGGNNSPQSLTSLQKSPGFGIGMTVMGICLWLVKRRTQSFEKGER
ncbi:MAG: hypothetical protein WC406_10735 [Methanoregula sp.]